MKRTLDLNSAAPAGGKAPFDTRKRKVRRWAAELPTANLAELARRLNEALAQVNAQPTPTGRLFYFLEAAGPAAALVFPHLERQYAGQPLPLNEAGSRASSLAVEIRAGFLRGYRNVLRAIVPDKEEASGWRVLWYRRELVTTLHRFIHYGDGLLEIYRMLHNDAPEGVWRRVHRCYRLAAKQGIHRRQVREWGEKKRSSSVEHAYKRLILSALLPTGAIPPVQQREINATFDDWVRLVRLGTPAEGTEGVLYLTRLARDFGPLALAEVARETLESENTCLVHTGRLCETISKRQARGGKGRWWRREKQLTPETLTVLHDNWCTVHHRSEARVAIDIPAEVAMGLSALFYLAGGRPSTGTTAAPRPAGPLLAKEHDVQGGQWLGKTKGGDVWETIYGDAPRAKPAPNLAPAGGKLQHGEHEYSSVAGRMVDKSDHGVAVVIARSELRQAAVGMPAAVRSQGDDWITGVIMRIKDRGDEMELGLRRLLTGAVPARLRVREGVRVSPPFDVIIGRTQEGRRAVAVPAVSALRTGDPEIELNGKPLPVGRGPVLVQSRYVDVFVLELSSTDAATAIEEAARAAATAPRPQRQAAKPASAAAPSLAGDAREQRVQKLMEETGLARADAEFIVEAEMAAGDKEHS
jgi:hypothetical protein